MEPIEDESENDIDDSSGGEENEHSNEFLHDSETEQSDIDDHADQPLPMGNHDKS